MLTGSTGQRSTLGAHGHVQSSGFLPIDEGETLLWEWRLIRRTAGVHLEGDEGLAPREGRVGQRYDVDGGTLPSVENRFDCGSW